MLCSPVVVILPAVTGAKRKAAQAIRAPAALAVCSPVNYADAHDYNDGAIAR